MASGGRERRWAAVVVVIGEVAWNSLDWMARNFCGTQSKSGLYSLTTISGCRCRLLLIAADGRSRELVQYSD